VVILRHALIDLLADLRRILDDSAKACRGSLLGRKQDVLLAGIEALRGLPWEVVVTGPWVEFGEAAWREGYYSLQRLEYTNLRSLSVSKFGRVYIPRFLRVSGRKHFDSNDAVSVASACEDGNGAG
jgi:hypothetical protein